MGGEAGSGSALIPRLQDRVDEIAAWVRGGGTGPLCLTGPHLSGKHSVVSEAAAQLLPTTEVLWLRPGERFETSKLFSTLRAQWERLCDARNGHILYPYANPPAEESAFYDCVTCTLPDAIELSTKSAACCGFSWSGRVHLDSDTRTEFTFHKKGHRLCPVTGFNPAEQGGTPSHLYLKPVKHRTPPPNSIFAVAELRERDRLRLEMAERWSMLFGNSAGIRRTQRALDAGTWGEVPSLRTEGEGDEPPQKRARHAEEAPEEEEEEGGRGLQPPGLSCGWRKTSCLLIVENWEKLGLDAEKSQLFCEFLEAVARVAPVLCTSVRQGCPPLPAARRMPLPRLHDTEKIAEVMRRTLRHSKDTGLNCSTAGIKTLVNYAADGLRTIPMMEHEVSSCLPRLADLEKIVKPGSDLYFQCIHTWLEHVDGSQFGYTQSRRYLLEDVPGDAGPDEDEDEGDEDIPEEVPSWVGLDWAPPKVELGFFKSVTMLAVFMCRIRPKVLQAAEDQPQKMRKGKKRALTALDRQRERVIDEHSTHAVTHDRVLAQIITLIHPYAGRQEETDMGDYWFTSVNLTGMHQDLDSALSDLGLKEPSSSQILPGSVTAQQAQQIGRSLGVPTPEQGGYRLLFGHHGFA